jgi:cyanophycin synthetase
MRNITFDLIDNAARQPEARAFWVSGECLTYGELNELTWQAATHLRRAGVQAGDVVGLTFIDQTNLALAILGTIRLGATIFPIPPSSSSLQREEMLRRLAVKLLFSDAPESDFDAKISRLHFSRKIIEKARIDHDAIDPEPKAHAVMVYGSGTTGDPKIFSLPHDKIHHLTKSRAETLSITKNEAYMICSGLNFSVSQRALFLMLSSGGEFSIPSAETFILDIMNVKPDILHLSVFHAERLLMLAQQRGGLDLSSTRITSIGGSVVSEDLRRRLQDNIKANLHINYSTNESHGICFARPEDIATTPGSVGRPVRGVSVEIVDDAHRPLPAGRVGEVRVKSPAAISAYYNGSDADRFKDGWFYPRDLAMWTEDGQMIYYGRSDHMMIMDGINIYPAEIERALIEHPAVCDAAAVPLSHPVHQHIPVCAVALHPGAKAEPEALQVFARERLGVRAPRLIVVLDAIPRNERGKLIRADLAETIRKDLERQTREKSSRMRDVKPKATTQVAVDFLAAGNVYFTSCASVLRLQGRIPNQGMSFDMAVTKAQEYLSRHSIPRPFLSADEEREASTFAGQAARLALILQRGVGLFVLGAQGWREFPEDKSQAAFSCMDRITGQLAAELALKILTLGNETECDQLAKKLVAAARPWTLPLAQTAMARGIPITIIARSDSPVLALGQGVKRRLFWKSFTPETSQLATALSTHKNVASGILRDAGLPAPRNIVVPDAALAVQAADALGYPVVVKPAASDFGRGVSTGNQNAVHVREAFVRAAEYGEVLVEEQIEGDQHRLLVVHGRCLMVVRFTPARVIGDGVSTVLDLVEKINLTREDRVSLAGVKIKLDQEALLVLQRQGLETTSIPEAGEIVHLRGNANLSSGGSRKEVTEVAHPAVLRLAEQAASLFGIDVAGIDYITTDITRSPTETGGAICEVNVTPGIIPETFLKIADRYLAPYFPAGTDGRVPTICLVGQPETRGLLSEGLAALLSTNVAQSDEVQFWGENGRGALPRRTAAALANPHVTGALITCTAQEISSTGIGIDRCSLAVLMPDVTTDAAVAILRTAAAVVAPASVFEALAYSGTAAQRVWIVGVNPPPDSYGFAGIVRPLAPDLIEVCPRNEEPWEVRTSPASADIVLLVAAGVALGLSESAISESLQALLTEQA